MRADNLTPEQALMILPQQQWDSAPTPLSLTAVEALEQGRILFLPELNFPLLDDEITLLDPALVDIKRKNISYWPETHKLSGVAIGVQPAHGVKTTVVCTSTLSLRAPTWVNVSCVSSPTSIPTVNTANGASVNPFLSWRDALCWNKPSCCRSTP